MKARAIVTGVLIGIVDPLGRPPGAIHDLSRDGGPVALLGIVKPDPGLDRALLFHRARENPLLGEGTDNRQVT